MGEDGPQLGPETGLEALLDRIEALESRLATLEAGARATADVHEAGVPSAADLHARAVRHRQERLARRHEPVTAAPPAAVSPAPSLPLPVWGAAPERSTRWPPPPATQGPPATWTPPTLPPQTRPVRPESAQVPAARPTVDVAEDAWGRSASEPEGPAWPSFSIRDLEERFAGRALAWTGGLALVAAAIFFLSLAFSRGWITEPLRVVIGLAAGMAAFAIGGVLLVRRSELLGHVLTAVGLGITSISLFAATRVYGLVVPELGLFGALVAAIAAAALAIRTGSVVVAAYGLIAALIAPPLVGASPTLVTLGFVAVTLIGTTAVSVYRSWRWLPPLAFVLAAPQLASWLAGDPDRTQALVALAGFGLINIVAAAGEEVRIRRDDLRSSSATLVLANATFLLWGGFVVLTGAAEPWRGTFVGLVAAAHVLIGAWFLSRQGLEHLFGNLVAGTGVACLALAAFVQLGATAVPMAWAAEAVALAWLAVRRMHRWSALAAIVLGIATVGHLLAVEYRLDELVRLPAPAFPAAFLHPEFGSLAAVLAAFAVTGLLVPGRRIRSLLAAIGVALAAYGLAFELPPPSFAAGLAWLIVAGVALDRLARHYGTNTTLDGIDGRLRWAWSASVVGAGLAVLVIAHLVAVEYPFTKLAWPLSPRYATPFLDAEFRSLVAVIAATGVVGLLVPARRARSLFAAVAVGLAGYGLAFEIVPPALAASLAWLALAAVALDLLCRRLGTRPAFAALDRLLGLSWAPVAAAGLASLAILHLVSAEYPLGSFGFPSGAPFATPFLHSEFGSLAAMLVALGVAGVLLPTRWIRSALAGTGVVLVAYAVTFEVAGPTLAAALSGLVVAGLLLDRAFVRWPGAREIALGDQRVDFAWFGSVGGATAGVLSVLALVVAWYPISRLGMRFVPPFLNPEGASLALVLAGLALAGVLVPVRVARSALAGLALLLVAWTLPFEFERAALVGSWVALLPAGILVDRVLARWRDEPRFGRLAAIVPQRRWAAWAGAAAWALAAGHALRFEIRPWDLQTPHLPLVAFTDERALVGGLLTAAALAAARWLEVSIARRTAAIAALATLAYLVPFEVRPDMVAVLWVWLAGSALIAATWDPAGPTLLRGIASGLVILAAAVAFALVAQPDRLWVTDAALGRPPLLPAWTLGVGAVAVALAVGSRLSWLKVWRPPLEVAAGVTALYLASIAVVDVFQRQVGGALATEELSKQAQVGLSVLWTSTGLVSLASGVVREHPLARQAGFVLLAIATAKVFVIDLASMDVAYRAIVFAALGVLLLMAAALVSRFRGPRSGPTGITGARPGPD